MKQQSFGEKSETGIFFFFFFFVFFVGGCKKEHKLCPYGPDQSWRWWPPIMRRFAPTHLLLSFSPIKGALSFDRFPSAFLFFFLFSFSFFISLFFFFSDFFFFFSDFFYLLVVRTLAVPSPIIWRHSFIITLFSFNLSSIHQRKHNRKTHSTFNGTCEERPAQENPLCRRNKKNYLHWLIKLTDDQSFGKVGTCLPSVAVSLHTTGSDINTLTSY